MTVHSGENIGIRYFHEKGSIMTGIISMILALFFILSGCSTEGLISEIRGEVPEEKNYTRHFKDSLYSITEKGLFSVEILSDKKELNIARDAAGIIIHDTDDEDVGGASVQVFLHIPAQDQEGSVLLNAADIGSGLYTVKDLDLKREGPWDIRVKITKGGAEDMAVFYFPTGNR